MSSQAKYLKMMKISGTGECLKQERSLFSLWTDSFLGNQTWIWACCWWCHKITCQIPTAFWWWFSWGQNSISTISWMFVIVLSSYTSQEHLWDFHFQSLSSGTLSTVINFLANELDTITIKIIILTISLILTLQRKPQLPPFSSVLPNDTPVFNVCKPRFQEKSLGSLTVWTQNISLIRIGTLQQYFENCVAIFHTACTWIG